MGLIRFFNSTEEKRLWEGPRSLEPVEVVDLSSDNRLTVEFTLLKRSFEDVALPWEEILAASYSLAMGLYKSDRTELTFTDVFTDLDATTKQGTLLLDTVAIDTALTGPPAVTVLNNCIFEIRIQDAAGNKHTTYRKTDVALNKPLITPASLSVPAGEIAATRSWASQIFMPRDGTPTAPAPMSEFFMTNAAGQQVVVRVDANFQMHVEPF